MITGLFTFAAIIKLGTMRFVKNTALVRKIILLFFTLHSLHLIFAQNKPDKEFSIFVGVIVRKRIFS